MKIGIDARLYGTRNRGLGRYSQEIVKSLEKIDQQNQYFVFLQKDNFDDYQPQNKNFQKVLADYRPYSLKEQLAFPWLLKKYRLDLAYFLHFNAPIFYNGRSLVTIHDLIISHYPNSRATTLPPIIYKIKLFFYNLIIKIVAQKAEKIVAVSEYTKSDIVKFLKVKPEKIKVVYEGIDLPAAGESDDSRQVLADLNITSRFLLYVGAAYPHKNLEKLILAFQKVLTSEPELQLVLVGKNDFFYQRLKDWLQKEAGGVADRLVFAGYLDDKKLACLYQSASAYVFPSLLEGFGLPPLEAQSYDLPVVSSNRSCLPEVLGESAVYFDPESVEEMAEKIGLVLSDEVLREKLIRQGRDNLKRYSWQKAAEEILSLFL